MQHDVGGWFADGYFSINSNAFNSHCVVVVFWIDDGWVRREGIECPPDAPAPPVLHCSLFVRPLNGSHISASLQCMSCFCALLFLHNNIVVIM